MADEEPVEPEQPITKPGKPGIGRPDNPNLPGPQPGDEYTDGEEVLTITAVGEQYALAVDPYGVEAAYPLLAADEGGLYEPVVPSPIVGRDTVLYEYDTGAEIGLWTNASVASATGRSLILYPDGTWDEQGGS